MKKSIRALALALVLSLLLPACALAGARRQYIIPDSNSRYLTEAELWEWDYESIGFIFNEIFARYGFNFDIGGAYYNYFNSRPWYTPNSDPNNSAACYPKLNKYDWANEKLCKQVRADMRALKTRNKNGKHYLDYIETSYFDVLSGFKYVNLTAGQRLAVYSAPSADSWRGGNGRAVVSTNGPVYVAGWDGNWLLVMYQTNNGAVRVGYAQSPKGVSNASNLDFDYIPVVCAVDANLTDDPATATSIMRRVSAGETVTYLSGFQNSRSWAYVETVVEGRTARGFIPASALNMVVDEEEEEDRQWGDEG